MTKEQLRVLLQVKTPEEIKEYYQDLSGTELIDFMDMMLEVMGENPDFEDNPMLEDSKKLVEESREKIETAIIDDNIQEMMKEIELDALFKEGDKAMMGMKNALIKQLLQEPENAELKKMIIEFMQIEKDAGFYNEQDWKEILHLL